MEICITRITTAIRETGSIERHSAALVGLWESCLEHNLAPQGGGAEDTPHAKIASDITSCILQVGTRARVQRRAVGESSSDGRMKGWMMDDGWKDLRHSVKEIKLLNTATMRRNRYMTGSVKCLSSSYHTRFVL